MNGLERLHYFNGQRLVARDLEVEQKYHLRVRRMLNAGLYSPGVVSGLMVTVVDAKHVRVSGGVALDAAGREVILLSDTTLAVPNRLPVSALPGFFLTIRYAERTMPDVRADCEPGIGTTPPSRIREAPELAFTETWPDQRQCGLAGHPEDCAVVLGLVLLDASCQVTGIESGVRQISHREVPGTVTPYALEGEKDIDPVNPKKLRFQIRGGIPDAVVLYLWADAISSLHYTELGEHHHHIGGVTVANTTVDLGAHTHKLADLTSSDDGRHSHKILQAGNDKYGSDIKHHDAIFTGPEVDDQLGSTGRLAYGPEGHADGDNYIRLDGMHHHTIPGPTTQGPAPNAATPHAHSLSGNVAANGNGPPASGNTPFQARLGPAYSFPDDVRLRYDGTDITGLVLAKLGWTKLGDGTKNHTMAAAGTGAIDLIQLGLNVGIGAHQLDIRVNKGGGKVLYNLYVE